MSPPTAPGSAAQHAAEQVPAPGTAPHAGAAPLATRVLRQAAYETGTALRNGEQLLVALVIPVAVLLGLTAIDLGAVPDPRVAHAITAVLTISVMGTAFTGQAIAVGFDRRYGALKRLGGTPLPPAVIIVGKVLATLVLVAGQSLVLGVIAAVMGWRPTLGGLVVGAVMIALGAIAFSAMGLLLGGTLKAEVVLALANLIWVLLLGLGGIVLPRTVLAEPIAAVVGALPSAALGDGLRAAFLTGTFDAWSALVHFGWGLAATALCLRTFRWSD